MFTSALAEIFQRFGTALKVTIVPFLILLVLFAGVGGVFYTNFAFIDSNGPQFGLLMILVVLAIIVISIILFAWTAISWHRAVLLNETVGFIPSLRGLPIGRYIGNTILIGFILVAIGFALSFVIGFAAAGLLTNINPTSFTAFSAGSIIIGAIAGLVLQFFWLRMAVILPGIAVDNPMGIGEGWSETRDISGQIFLLSVIITVISTGFSLLLLPFQFTAPFLVLALQIPFNFIYFMFGISIVTEIYKRVSHVDNSANVFE